MATITDADFEGTYPPSGYSEAGTTGNIGTSTVQANSPVTSMRVNNGSAATAWIANTVATRMIVMRFYVRIDTEVSATASMVQFTVAGGNVYLRLLATHAFRLTLNATNYGGPVYSLGQWYRIDIRVDTNANPWVVDWQVDGSAQTQRTIALTAADMTAINIGMITSVTCDLYFDDVKITDQSTDYPIGAIVVAGDPTYQYVNAGYYP